MLVLYACLLLYGAWPNSAGAAPFRRTNASLSHPFQLSAPAESESSQLASEEHLGKGRSQEPQSQSFVSAKVEQRRRKQQTQETDEGRGLALPRWQPWPGANLSEVPKV